MNDREDLDQHMDGYDDNHIFKLRHENMDELVC